MSKKPVAIIKSDPNATNEELEVLAAAIVDSLASPPKEEE